MKSKIFLLLFLAAIVSSCTQKSTSTNSEETKAQQSTNSNDKLKAIESSSQTIEVEAENQDTINVEKPSIESDIRFIQDKYAIISKATDYKIVPFETQCDERSSTELERKYNPKRELSYLKYVECGGHGCRTKHHYYWQGELIFIFHKNDYTPGSSHIIEEHRTYFKNGKMIRCLEKEAVYYEGQAPMEELLEKAENKEVDCAPEKLTANLSEIETLKIDEAQKYFCSSSPQ